MHKDRSKLGPFQSIPKGILNAIGKHEELISNNERFTALIKAYREWVASSDYDPTEDDLAFFKKWASTNYQIPVEYFGALVDLPEAQRYADRFQVQPCSSTQWKIIHEGSGPVPPPPPTVAGLLFSGSGNLHFDTDYFDSIVVSGHEDETPTRDSYSDGENPTYGQLYSWSYNNIYWTASPRPAVGDTVYTNASWDVTDTMEVAGTVTEASLTIFEQSPDGINWTDAPAEIPISTPVYLRSKNPISKVPKIECDSFSVEGDVRYLFNPTGSGNPDCNSLFTNTNIVDASGLDLSHLTPTVSGTQSTLGKMFEGCTSLVAAPELPFTSIIPYEYSRMFSGCTSLASAPALPATTLASHCYASMFSNCTALTSAPVLPATTLADNCYDSMFSYSGLTSAPVLPATTLAPYCYTWMFNYCSSLTNLPVLPATTLADYCYQGMFQGCPSISQLPELIAPILTSGCYANMFSNSGITSIPNNYLDNADEAGYRSLYQMFSNCSSLTNSPEISIPTLGNNACEAIFNGCSSLTTTGDIKVTTAGTSAFQNAFTSCTSLTDIPSIDVTNPGEKSFSLAFYKCTGLVNVTKVLPSANLGQSVYLRAFEACTNLQTVPINMLPATAPISNMYDRMFNQCSKLTQAPDIMITSFSSANEATAVVSMFNSCTSLHTINCYTESITYTGNITWGTAGSGSPRGSFHCKPGVFTTGKYPSGWTLVEDL